MTYSEKLKDPRWQKKRLEIMQRDGFKCRNCGDDKGTLHVHHCVYVRGHEPWEYDKSLLTLCETCHSDRHYWTEVLLSSTSTHNNQELSMLATFLHLKAFGKESELSLQSKGAPP